MLDKDGTHILRGIVSNRLGESCGQDDFYVFTKVHAFMPWVKSMIEENGGMASCGYTISAPPTKGKTR